jgi:hypothetical protein
MIAANASGRKGAAMPVIGRLDGQVDELIIRPISERRRGEEPPTSDEDSGEPLPSPTTHTPASNQSSAERDELPVWLL